MEKLNITTDKKDPSPSDEDKKGCSISDEDKKGCYLSDEDKKDSSPSDEDKKGCSISDEDKKMSLGDRMKMYEKLSENMSSILPYLPYVARLDGKSFSKFTSGFKKPFDSIIIRSMVSTMNDLMEEFNAKTGYCHSDEITLIFPPVCTKKDYEDNIIPGEMKTHEFSGRIMKLCSVYSGMCSVRFNYHINKELEKIININPGEYKKSTIEAVRSYRCCFDSRIIVFPEDKSYEVCNHMIWRSLYDCNRNCVQAYAHHYLGNKNVHKKNNVEMIEMLKIKNINWDDVPLAHKHGIYAKMVLIKKKSEDGKTEYIRRDILNQSFIIKCDDYFQNLLFEKYWSNELSDLKNNVLNLIK